MSNREKFWAFFLLPPDMIFSGRIETFILATSASQQVIFRYWGPAPPQPRIDATGIGDKNASGYQYRPNLE